MRNTKHNVMKRNKSRNALHYIQVGAQRYKDTIVISSATSASYCLALLERKFTVQPRIGCSAPLVLLIFYAVPRHGCAVFLGDPQKHCAAISSHVTEAIDMGPSLASKTLFLLCFNLGLTKFRSKQNDEIWYFCLDFLLIWPVLYWALCHWTAFYIDFVDILYCFQACMSSILEWFIKTLCSYLLVCDERNWHGTFSSIKNSVFDMLYICVDNISIKTNLCNLNIFRDFSHSHDRHYCEIHGAEHPTPKSSLLFPPNAFWSYVYVTDYTAAKSISKYYLVVEPFLQREDVSHTVGFGGDTQVDVNLAPEWHKSIISGVTARQKT